MLTVSGYDMSPFVRRYAKYLSEKSVSYMKVAFDFCKVKRGKDGGTIRKMSAEKLLKTLPILHEQDSHRQSQYFIYSFTVFHIPTNFVWIPERANRIMFAEAGLASIVDTSKCATD